MKKRSRYLIVLTCLFVLINFTTVNAQPAVGDFQTFQSGNWSVKATWARWDGSSWINPAPNTPTSGDGKITILNSHTVSVPANHTVDEVTVNAGATIIILNTLTVNLGPGTADMVINGTMEISSGTIIVNGRLVLSSGATLRTSAVTGVKGAFTGTGVKTFSAGAKYIFNGTAAQSTGFSGLSAGNPNSITIDNSSGVTLDTSLTVTGTLTFTNGRIITSANTLNIGDGGGVVGAGVGKYVHGNLGRVVGSSGSPTISFDIGDAANYAPVSVVINSLSAGGTLTASTTGNQHGSIASSKISDSRYVNRYWRLTNSGMTFTDYSATFNFVSEDIVGGADPNEFIAGKYNGVLWSYPTIGSKTPTSTQITGEANFSDFAIGEMKTFAITATAGVNGSINPSGVTYVAYGDSLQYTITPNANYSIDTVLVDGNFIGAATSYTFSNITADHTINAAFFIRVFTLTVNAVNGTVTKNPDQTEFDSASFVQLTAIPNPEYMFKGWSGDLEGTTNPVYIFMDADKNITGNFLRTIDISLEKGWNLISVPFVQSNYYAIDIFPGLIGDLYWFNPSLGTYAPEDTSELGKGYWAFYQNARMVTVTGSDPNPIILNCKAGWNLIGSCEMPVDVSSLILSDGAEISGNVVYVFVSGSGYVPQAIINPGRGGWAYVTADCTITIP